MKKMSSKLLLVAMLVLNVAMVSAQEVSDAAQQSKSFHQVFKERFIEGGPMYMAPILLCLIIGLAVAIERIIYLNMATTNSKILKKLWIAKVLKLQKKYAVTLKAL